MILVWAWVKRHWKWIVFPVGVLGSVLGWYLWWRSDPPLKDGSGVPDGVVDKALKDVSSAAEERDLSLKQIEEDHADKLSAMSAEQKKVYEEVKKRPIEEIALWIDKL